MPDTFTTLWQRLRLRASAIDALLARDYIRDAFNQLSETREWSWTMGHGTFYSPAILTPDTVSVTWGIPIVTSTGNLFTENVIGLQIRIGGSGGASFPTYTIIQYVAPNQVVIDQPWIGPSLTGQTYQVFQCYFPVPEDFQYFVSLVNTSANYRLFTQASQAQFDSLDPQRTNTGTPYGCAFYDFTKNFIGSIGPVVRIIGSGTAPVSTTETGWTYPTSAIFTVQIVTGGSIGTATFQWKQDAQAFGAEITTPDDGSIYNLASGAAVYFPDGTYNAGDVFVFHCAAVTTSGAQRYELWPRPINTPYVFPYLYRRTPPALTDEQPQLPEPIANRGDVLLEMALANCARWPGTDTMRNPYYDLNLARQHDLRAEAFRNDLEVKDDSTAPKDLIFNTPYHSGVPILDGSYLQVHDGALWTNW